MDRYKFHHESVPLSHYGLLAAVLLAGVALRFWQIDLKPLWRDEVITAIFGLGRRYDEVATAQFIDVAAVQSWFTLQPGVSCAEISQQVATDSVHPPLFFCVLYRWLSWLPISAAGLAGALRSLPAWCGVGAIAALYIVNRLAFSARAGLMAAGLMALSPFAVYLSQEARHYTLPMLLITLGLVALLLMQQDVMRQQFRAWVWFGWIGVNLLGLYVHYFVAMAVVAQVAALVGWMLWHRMGTRLGWGAIALSTFAITLGYLPWLPTLLSHQSRSETDWLALAPGIGGVVNPLAQGLVSWVVMIIMLPVEDQPLAIAIPLAMVMLGVAGWVFWQALRGLRYLWHLSPEHPPLLLLLGFVAVVLLQYLIVIYGLGQDITLAPRYTFVYYPGLCALLGVALVHVPPRKRRRTRFSTKLRLVSPLDLTVTFGQVVQAVVLLVSLFSAVLVIHGYGFHKSFNPRLLAQTMAAGTDQPVAVAVSTQSFQDTALGLSVGLELAKLEPGVQGAIAFLPRTEGYEQLWQDLQAVPLPYALPFDLWLMANPDLTESATPPTIQVQVANSATPVTCIQSATVQLPTFNVAHPRYSCGR